MMFFSFSFFLMNFQFIFRTSIFYVQVFVQNHQYCIPVRIVDLSYLVAFSYKIYPIFFFFLKYFQYFFGTSIFYLKVFVRKWWHSVPIKILDHSDLLGHSHTKFTRVHFFVLLKFQFFSWTSNFYRQVFVQKCQHCNPVKILDHSDLGVFSYRIYANFFL